MEVNAKQLLEVGAHFGHKKNRWNPKMEKFIYTTRNNIHIINIEITLKLLKKAVQFAREIAEKGGTILFVGTKKQAQNAIEEAAKRCGMPYVSNRWWGGLFTNFSQIQNSIKNYIDLKNNIDQFKSNKKILAKKTRLLEKLDKDLKGLVNFWQLPDAVYIVDPSYETIAVKEIKSKNIPIIALLDTDCDPDIADWPIPANDDALRSVKLITNLIADAICEAKGIAEKKENNAADENEAKQEKSTEE